MAEAWITLSEADIQTELNGQEFEQWRNAAKYGGEVDPVANILASVTNFVRGYIARDPDNTLGPTGTLPACLKEVALPIVTLRIMKRSFGEVSDPSGARKAAAETAMGILRDIAKGEGPSIPYPEDPVEDSRPAALFAYSNDGTVAEMTRDDQDGSAI